MLIYYISVFFFCQEKTKNFAFGKAPHYDKKLPYLFFTRNPPRICGFGGDCGGFYHFHEKNELFP